ncbi:MAG: hypothetical protein HY048_07810 [Acidobacteria bacterium]|nr:hypothetical protein [Acidobacteriota bacterium]
MSQVATVVFLVLFLTPAVSAQDGSTASAPTPDTAARVEGALQFLAGGALGLAMHEGGHLVFDAAFDAQPRLTGVHFGPFPFFAITHDASVSPRREFTISSAGFWVQSASSEWLLTRHRLRDEHAAVAKGILAFNVLNSTGYAMVALARAGPFERDTRGMASGSGVDERGIALVVLAPAVLDAYRYYYPDARWARWASRIAKAGSVVLVAK